MKLPRALHKPGFRQLLGRVAAYCAGFIIISLIIGNVIVPGPLLYSLWFFVYGGLGHVALAMAAFFIALAHRSLAQLPKTPAGDKKWLLATAALTALFVSIGTTVRTSPELLELHFWSLLITLHLAFLLIFITLGLALFHPRALRMLYARLRKPFWICVGIGIGFYAAMRVVWLSWPLLSWGVTRIVYGLLQVFPFSTTFVPPRILVVDTFPVEIAEACSGVFSIFLFTSLYLLMLVIDWNRLQKARAAVAFAGLLLGLYFMNVIRVTAIILIGVYYSPALAMSLFHSYAGVILFLAFYVVYLWWAYPWITRAQD